MSDMSDFDKAVVAAMLKAREIGVQMLASDCEEILQAAKQSMQGEAVGEVYDHDSYDHNGQEFMRVDWKNDMLPVGTKLYTHAPDSAARIAELEAQLQTVSEARADLTDYVGKLIDEKAKMQAENEALRKQLRYCRDDYAYIPTQIIQCTNGLCDWIRGRFRVIDASLNIKGGAE